MVEVIGSQPSPFITPLPLPPLSLSIGTKHKVTHINLALQDWAVDEYADGELVLKVMLKLAIHTPHGGPYHFTLRRRYQVSVPPNFKGIRLSRAPWTLRGRALVITPEVEFYEEARKEVVTKRMTEERGITEDAGYAFYGKSGVLSL